MIHTYININIVIFSIFRFNITFSYLTITIGIDPGYSKEDFYDKVSITLRIHVLNLKMELGKDMMRIRVSGGPNQDLFLFVFL